MFIEISDLSFKYKKHDKNVIDDLSIRLPESRRTCIIGKSGSGKSTLLRLIAGLEIPHSGSIMINNEVFFDSKTFIQPEKRGIGMVFQDYALFPHLTVAENILFGVKLMFKSKKEEILTNVLEFIRMSDFKNRYPYELSGGQQQRVALARALILKPKLLLLDEPLCNLDASLKAEIRAELKEIIDFSEITTLMVTHDKEDCLKLADYVIVLRDGRIEQKGEIMDVVKKPISKYVKELLH